MENRLKDVLKAAGFDPESVKPTDQALEAMGGVSRKRWGQLIRGEKPLLHTEAAAIGCWLRIDPGHLLPTDFDPTAIRLAMSDECSPLPIFEPYNP